MRKVWGRAGKSVAGLSVLIALVWTFGPYEDVDLSAEFDPRAFGEGVQVYFDSVESAYDDITPGTQKRVIWAGQRESRTPLSILYVHGFSATSEEIRPVPDRIAQALGANLVFTRLRGHGRSGDAMAEATVNAWMQDVAEGLAAARAVGERVVVISTSTGGTLVAAATDDDAMMQDVAALIFVSPNFGINHPLAFVSTWPFARAIIALVEGRERSFEARSDMQEKFWTTRYPTSAVAVLAALVKRVSGMDFSGVTVPTLFWYSEEDRVVRPDITAKIAARWGGPVSVKTVKMGPGDDQNAHVITGDILSPGQTTAAVNGMLAWLTTALRN